MFSKSDLYTEDRHDGREYDQKRILAKLERMNVEFMKTINHPKRAKKEEKSEQKLRKRSTSHRLTKKNIEDLLSFFREGSCLQDLAKIFKISTETARYHILKRIDKRTLLNLCSKLMKERK
jgi:hypothetical protein